MTRLTKRRLDAIIEALNSRLAGEINAEFGKDWDGPTQEDYEAALEWAQQQRASREKV